MGKKKIGTVQLSVRKSAGELYAPEKPTPLDALPQEVRDRIDTLAGAMSKCGNNTETFKWTPALKTLRDHIMYDLMREGINKRDVAYLLSAKFGYDYHTIRQWYEKALVALAEEAKEDAPVIREILGERIEHLYRKCLEKKDYKTALACVVEMGRMRGVVEDSKMIMNNIVFQFGDEAVIPGIQGEEYIIDNEKDGSRI